MPPLHRSALALNHTQKSMKPLFLIALAFPVLTSCDVKVDNTDPPANKETTIVTPGEKKTENNTTIVTPPAEKKTENNTTLVNPAPKVEKKETNTTIINPPKP